MEVWEKVFVKDAEFLQSTHGKVGCVICHGGDSREEDKELAHADLIIDPSDGNCNTSEHSNIVAGTDDRNACMCCWDSASAYVDVAGINGENVLI